MWTIASELKNYETNVIMITFVVSALGTVLNNLEKKLVELKVRGRIKIYTIQTTSFQKLAVCGGVKN